MAIETDMLLCDRHRQLMVGERAIKLARTCILTELANSEDYRRARAEGTPAVNSLLAQVTPVCCRLGEETMTVLALDVQLRLGSSAL
jgi:hypothetical protein